MLPPLLFELALSAGLAGAAQADSGDSPLQQVAERVDLYGRFDGNLALSEEDATFENNSSRFGIKAELDVLGDWAVFGQGEWRLNLGSGDTSYNISENGDTGLATLEPTTRNAFQTRLGLVGLRFRDFGALTLGKQWGVYYDVSQWTDVYTVFGAHGSSTYNAGTDGGQTGEGRANDAVAYRVGLGPLKLGVQAQFLDSRPNVVDGLSGSLVGELGRGLSIGAAYSHAFLDFGVPIIGYDGGDAQALTGGLRFERAGWQIAVVDTWTRNHEFVATGAGTVVYDTWGAELYVSVRLREQLMPYLGFDFAIPHGLDTRFVDPNFGTRDALAGVRWLFGPGTFAYIEGRAGGSVDADGTPAPDLITVGLRLSYSLRRGLGLDS